MASNPPEREDAGSERRGVTFIVPCFNEDPSVVLATVARIRAAASEAKWDHEVIVVDDCSGRTAYDEAGLGGARLLRHKVNRGYGAALSTGLRAARFPWIGMVDADGTYPVERFSGMLELTRDFQMIVGARKWQDIHWLRRIPKRCLTWLASFLANHAIPDLNSGMRIFHRELYDGHRRIFPDRFSFSSTLTMVGLTSGYEVSFVGIDYFERVAALPLAPDTANFESLVDALNASGFAVIGTVEDAIAQVARLRTQSKGFGTFLLMGHEWADTEATRHSYELIARYVAPEFQGSSSTLTASRDWAAENRPEFIGAAGNAVMSAIQKHHDEKAAKSANV